MFKLYASIICALLTNIMQSMDQPPTDQDILLHFKDAKNTRCINFDINTSSPLYAKLNPLKQGNVVIINTNLRDIKQLCSLNYKHELGDIFHDVFNNLLAQKTNRLINESLQQQQNQPQKKSCPFCIIL